MSEIIGKCRCGGYVRWIPMFGPNRDLGGCDKCKEFKFFTDANIPPQPAAAQEPQWVGWLRNDVEDDDALAAAPQPQADECPACKLGQATCGYHARNPATPPAQECKHKWRNSDRADPMLPCAWVQQCAKCGAYEDEN